MVPYTRQIQLVSNVKEEERRAEFRWKMLMEDCKGNDCLLPLSDPRSIRVQSIAANMIRALKVGLRLEKECKVNGHSCEINGNFRDYMKPNQMWDHKLLWKPSTKHLDNGKDWEVYVLNCIEKEVALAQSGHVCHFNKRIVISRGLLEGLKSDAENEREANHIGLMLMASAGYDPQAAIEAFKKIGQIYDDNILKRSKEMGNALVVYREVKSLMNLNTVSKMV
nr:uncharacterized protein LOC112031517 [Quercus suber]